MEIRILDRWNGIGIEPGTILDFFLTASASQEKSQPRNGLTWDFW